ncbi:hypothetical protein LPJ71_007493, partial [Coemansia sp. S17]
MGRASAISSINQGSTSDLVSYSMSSAPSSLPTTTASARRNTLDLQSRPQSSAARSLQRSSAANVGASPASPMPPVPQRPATQRLMQAQLPISSSNNQRPPPITTSQSFWGRLSRRMTHARNTSVSAPVIHPPVPSDDGDACQFCGHTRMIQFAVATASADPASPHTPPSLSVCENCRRVKDLPATPSLKLRARTLCTPSRSMSTVPLIQMTLSGVSMEELFMLIQDRFSEANWVVSFKALILVHILMHESNGPTIYDYLIHHSNALDMTRFRDRHGTKGVSEFEQSKNVRTYASYLNDKVLAFKAIRIDHVTQKNPAGSQIYQKAPSDIKFMLLEVSTIQKQLHSVLKNRFESDTLDNETTFSAFRYCLRDMLKLFQVMNLGVMKMLKVYFEMREDDMRRALDLYKRFVKLTDRTDEYLKVARQFENIFGFSIPNLIHAPLSLSKALEEFLDMPVEERAATVSEMKSARRPEKESPPASATANKTGTVGASAARNKPNYGLRLKPELLALTDDTPPPPPSPTTKVAGKTSVAGAPAAQARSATTAPLAAASTAATAAVGKKPAAKAETDFIDFFSSIDDEVTAAADNSLGASNTAAVAAFGYSMPMDNSSGFVSEQQAVANNAMMVQGGGGGMTDFDA